MRAAGRGAESPTGAFDAARFLRAARAETRARIPRTDRFVDAYTWVLVGAAVAAWLWGGVSGFGAQLGTVVAASAPGGALHREAPAWLGPGFPLLGAAVLVLAAWAGAVRTLLALGPVGIAPDRAFWVWRLPVADDREPLRALRGVIVAVGAAGALLGGCAGLAAHWAGAPGTAGPGTAVPVGVGAGIGAVLGAGAVLVAARRQAARAGVDRAGQLPGWELRRAGARTRYLGNAVRLMSAADLRQSLTGAEVVRAGRPGRRLPAWVRGPRRVVLFAALAAQARTRWRLGAALDLGVLAVLLVAFSAAMLPAAWAGLVVVAFRGLGRGVAHVVSARAGNAAERHLPLSGSAAARVRLLLPCALNAAVVGAACLLAGLAVRGPVLPLTAVGLVAGAGVGAAAVHRILGPDPDLTEPPVESPFGPIPRAQLSSYGRGLLLVALLAAGPAVVVAVPHLWPGVLGAVAALTALAAGLAVATGEKA